MSSRFVALSIDQLRSICQGLNTAAKKLEKAREAAEQSELTEVYLEWSESHWQAFDRLFATGNKAEGQVQIQIMAKSQKRISHFERTQAKSRRDVERRRERQAERQAAGQTEAPIRKRGRPRRTIEVETKSEI